MPGTKTRVLIVDDSAAMRQLLTAILSADPALEVIGTAPDPFIAREKIKSLNPDVITLDVEMPRMDGPTFLEKLMRGRPTPVVLVSSLTQKGCDTTMQALELGAVDYFPKPCVDTLTGVADAADEIRSKVRNAARANVRALSAARPVAAPPAVGKIRLTNQIIAIGASTGGTEAIREVLSQMPADSPGIVVVQHMPPGFTASFAARLNSQCVIQVSEARDGDRILPGHALIAPGDFHTEVQISGANAQVRVYQGERVSMHRPSVDVLFRSCAKNLGKNAIGVIMTGMGSDGAHGMREMHDAGAHTIAQDEATCVVFGMPREAIEHGGVDQIVPLPKIPEEIIRACQTK